MLRFPPVNRDNVRMENTAGAHAGRAAPDPRALAVRAWDKDRGRDQARAENSVRNELAPISTLSNPRAMPTRRPSRVIEWAFPVDLVADSAEARLGKADLPTVGTAADREAVPGAARATDNIVRKVEGRAAAKEAVRAAA